MKKAWKIVAVAGIIILLIGAICIGVSLITGADVTRLSDLFFSRYDIEAYKALLTELIQNFLGMLPLA